MHFEADRTVFFDGAREDASLPVSPSVLADRHWPHGLPGALQMERAIDDVESAIEQAGLVHADRGVLLATDSLQHLLPDLLKRGTLCSRDNMEDAFTRWVGSSYAGGRGGAGLELHGESAAALLLLREVMHHLGFSAIRTQG
jgi:hypothetical protein